MKQFGFLTLFLFASCISVAEPKEGSHSDAGEGLKNEAVSELREKPSEQPKEWDLNKGRAATPQQNCLFISGTNIGTGDPPDGNPQKRNFGLVKQGTSVEIGIQLYNFCDDPEAIFLGITWRDRPDAGMKSFPFKVLSKPEYGQSFFTEISDGYARFQLRFTPRESGSQKATMRIHFVLGYTDIIFLAKTP